MYGSLKAPEVLPVGKSLSHLKGPATPTISTKAAIPSDKLQSRDCGQIQLSRASTAVKRTKGQQEEKNLGTCESVQ